ncbi:MAG: hypothetical protein NZ602_12520 [Thermoguttaceae bacterium]|nr:hypothetical protein [Thermoguttaceae bacterium]MDW8037306.1 hypothetical protein [Thermoguttaceae bacterium]
MACWCQAQELGSAPGWLSKAADGVGRIRQSAFEPEVVPSAEEAKSPISGVPEAPPEIGTFRPPSQNDRFSTPSEMESYPLWEEELMGVGPFCDLCGHGANFMPDWYIDQRVTIWHRSRPRRMRISGVGGFATVDDEQVFFTTGVMGTRSPSFDVAAGYAAVLRHYLRPARENTDLYAEAIYFGFNTWQETRDVYATQRLSSTTGSGTNQQTITFGNLFTPYTRDRDGMFSGIGGFDRADHHQLYYESRLHNVEVNLRIVPRGRPDRLVLHPNGHWRRQCVPGIYGTYLVGIRYFSLQEQCNFLAEGVTEFYDSNGNRTQQANTWGRYDVNTYNEMLGLQFGLDVKYRQCTVEWGGECKLVPCIDFAGHTSRIRASDPTTNTSFDVWLRDREDDVALLGEVSVVGYYHLRPNLSLRASWDMMWAVGVALAPEQLKFHPNPDNRLNNNGMVYYQGVSLGLIWQR